MNAASSGGDPGPFLHLKFGVGRPPPHEHEVHEGGGSAPQLLLFAHEIELDPAIHSRNLHETLRTDVQRAGIARWLEQNFKEDAYIYDVVHRRQGDRGMFALVTKNWARSVGDPKLHLSLYVYQDHMHVATWHAYSDRSVSYSRAGDENAPPPEGSDPYSTPEALEAAAAAASAALPTSSSFSSKEHDDDGRPRFDRPAALPTDSSDLDDTDEVPFKPEEVVQPPSVAKNGRSSRSARKQPPPATTSTEAEEPESDTSSSAQAEEEEQLQPKKSSRRSMDKSESDRSSDSPSRSRSPSPPPSPQPQPPPQQPSRRSSRRARRPVSDAESPSSSSEVSGPAYPIVKSQPLGKSRSDRRGAESRPSPPSPKKKSERGRDRTPVSPVAQCLSPPPAASHKGETDRLAQQQRERSRRRARPAAVPKPEPEPSPSTSRSRSRSPSPVRNPQTERGRCSARETGSASENEQESEKPIADVRRRDRSARRPKPPRSPSPSPSQVEAPPTKSKTSSAKPVAGLKKDRVHERSSRSESRSPSPPARSTKTGQSKRSTRRDSEAETLRTEDEPPRRGRSRGPVEPTAPPPQLDRKPSWRSVSRNRHRRNGSDSSGDDTLVRGNLVDADLDIPAGGEATLLTAKRRASISERSARRPARPRRDDSFDPEEVQQPPRSVAEPPKPQTATAVLGSWIKSVGTLLKPEGEPRATAAATAADSEAEELEARLRRKAERAERRKARAARRAARQIDASAFEDTEVDRTASELEQSDRSSRRRPPQEDEPRRSHCQPETEEPVSKPARPALRERAMSFSATFDSGFKNLRESVNKIVSGADEPPDSASSAESEDVDRRRSRHRARSRQRREKPEDESGPQHQRRRRMNAKELPEDRQPRDGLVEERQSRSERPESTQPLRKLRERSRRRETNPEDRQDDPKPRPTSAPVTPPSDEDDALLLQRRIKESARVRDKPAIEEDASDLPNRSSSRATESSSRSARQTRPPPLRVDDSSAPERPSSGRVPRSDAPSRQQAQSTRDREDAVAVDRTASRSAQSSSAPADSGPTTLDMRAKYVEDQDAAPDRERARHDYEKERRRESSVLRSRPSSARQSTLKPSQPGHDDFSAEPTLPRRRQVGQVALDDAAPAEQARLSSSSAACSPSVSMPSLSTSEFLASQRQQRRSRPPPSRPANADYSRGGHHPGCDNLTDEEEESRFVAARGSSSTLTTSTATAPISARRDPSARTTTPKREREEGEYVSPIPAAPAPLSTRSSLPTYGDSGPLLRPQPHRAQHQLQLSFGGGVGGSVPDSKSHSYPNLNSASDGERTSASRATTTRSHFLRHDDPSSLPRNTLFSRSRQPAFDLVSASSSVADSDTDSDSQEEEDGEATSDPDSVAFRRRRRYDQSDRQLGRMGDWNDSRGQSAPSRRFEGVADDDDDDDDDDGTLRGRDDCRPQQGDEGSARPGRGDGGGGDYDWGDYYDYDGDGSLFQHSAAAATPLSIRSTAIASSLSPSDKNGLLPDAAPFSSVAASSSSSSSSSRTNIFGAAPNPPSRTTTTKSRTMVSPRPPPSSRMSGYPTATAAAPETEDRRGGWRDLQQQSGSHYDGLGLGSLSSSSRKTQEEGAGASASFERLTAKGRESGSVQLFGRHNAPVSRRMARRLGMS